VGLHDFNLLFFSLGNHRDRGEYTRCSKFSRGPVAIHVGPIPPSPDGIREMKTGEHFALACAPTGRIPMFFVKPTGWDLVRMMWWGLWNPPPKLELPPLKKVQMAPDTHCPYCKRPL